MKTLKIHFNFMSKYGIIKRDLCSPQKERGRERALKKLLMICADGDKTLAEWDTETVSRVRLSEIEQEFNGRVAQGYFAADISEKKDVLIRKFDPNAEILLIPRVQGG
jgi:hypothetical protein